MNRRSSPGEPSPSSKTPTATSSSFPAAEAPSAAGGALDEFGEIARLFRPLTGGAPEALDLKDDAAAIPMGDGSTLVVTTDTVVEGVHTPMGEAPDLIAKKLLRANLSDVAAKGAEPYGWFLNVAWPMRYALREREAFARGLAEDSRRFGLRLMGGDTVRGGDGLVATATLMGKTSRFVPRAGARPGDSLWVTGSIGDAGLGLRLALGEALDGLSHEQADALLGRYRLPEPRLTLAPALRRHASACADVSDGLLADAGRIAEASGVGVEIDVERLPLSAAAAVWLAAAADPNSARLALATAGDDYELICTCAPGEGEALQAAAAGVGLALTAIGHVVQGQGVHVTAGGRAIAVERLGYRHG